jgi:hypothetical protein
MQAATIIHADPQHGPPPLSSIGTAPSPDGGDLAEIFKLASQICEVLLAASIALDDAYKAIHHGFLVKIMPIIEEHNEDVMHGDNSRVAIPAESSIVLPKTHLRYKHRNRCQNIDIGMSNS